MTYDFDTPINRIGTDCLKFDRPEKRGRANDLLSLWVADMDFATAPEILEALEKRVKHGIFGYTEPGPDYYAALDRWCHERYGWHVAEDQVTITPGVVYALAASVRAYTDPGDAVIIQQPVYYPFSMVVQDNGRKLVNAPLIYENGSYSIDFDAFEQKVVESNAKLFILCNPHNPVGRAWSSEELRRIGKICLDHGIVVVSDEIHMDFARPGHVHTSFATLDDDIVANSVICTSASKTFNLAGLQIANIVISDKRLRRRFRSAVNASGFSQANTLGLTATQAAYEHGGAWLEELKDYLEANWALLGNSLRDRMPQLRLVEAESTYLAWIDCRALGLEGNRLERFIEDKAKLWLDCGHIFGADGDGFIRINIATQRSYLEQALDRLADAVDSL